MVSPSQTRFPPLGPLLAIAMMAPSKRQCILRGPIPPTAEKGYSQQLSFRRRAFSETWRLNNPSPSVPRYSALKDNGANGLGGHSHECFSDKDPSGQRQLRERCPCDAGGGRAL